jgi:hypothetical protein
MLIMYHLFPKKASIFQGEVPLSIRNCYNSLNLRFTFARFLIILYTQNKLSAALARKRILPMGFDPFFSEECAFI